jgi:hypothetical protein
MKIKTIDINALEWFDKVNGNSYFAGEVTINYGTKTQKGFNIPFQYGYGTQYIQEASKRLIKDGYIKSDEKHFVLWRYCNDNKIVLRHNIKDSLKRDLKAYNN